MMPDPPIHSIRVSSFSKLTALCYQSWVLVTLSIADNWLSHKNLEAKKNGLGQSKWIMEFRQLRGFSDCVRIAAFPGSRTFEKVLRIPLLLLEKTRIGGLNRCFSTNCPHHLCTQNGQTVKTATEHNSVVSWPLLVCYSKRTSMKSVKLVVCRSKSNRRWDKNSRSVIRRFYKQHLWLRYYVDLYLRF